MFILLTAAFLTSIVIGAAVPNSDPVANFCRRVDHQYETILTVATIVKNETLYIDGGVETFAEVNNGWSAEGTHILGYNTGLIKVDLKSPWNWKQNISTTFVNKTENPRTGTEPPILVRGALYSGSPKDTKIYLYGGTTSYVNTSFPGFQRPTSSQYALWSFDTADNTWNQYDVTLEAPWRPAGGAYAETMEHGLAIYLNGFINNGTSNALESQGAFLRYLDGLVVIDTDSQTATNVSTASLDNFPRAKGSMAYVPHVGSKGMLVALGGVTKPTSDTSASNEGTFLTFEEIDFLDVSSYKQKASGDTPDVRTDFCLVTVSAKDHSSHNIYLYGGKSASQIYDQIYILSIPSFTWTKVFEGKSPRFGHTCHDVMSGCDWEIASVAIFDLSTLTWGSIYNHLLGVIGGNADGYADLQSPSDGFTDTNIAHFFKQSSGNNPDNGRSSKDGVGVGTLVGAVVGSVAGAGTIIAFLFYLIRRNRTKQSCATASHGGQPEHPTGIIWRNRDAPTVELEETYIHTSNIQTQ
ncbi:hypothetical protein BDV25DRAFT_168147 [Aspergillus avenaceus]|uniref:Kelch repeat protein n=1 Tax=Aspergillus avenaceus TaxID=36643 RepID=A0A5N6U5M1_ASPAV|nr:hypothetical protein BDV25DRAFT_168147 [Aspergillus avenaceus]